MRGHEGQPTESQFCPQYLAPRCQREGLNSGNMNENDTKDDHQDGISAHRSYMEVLGGLRSSFAHKY